jgi:hypothetical protein
VPVAFDVGVGIAYIALLIGYRLGALDRWLGPRRPYRLPEEQIEREFPARHREEARALIEAVATYVPPAERDAVLFRLLARSRGSVRRLRDGAVRELAVLPDGRRVPAPAGGNDA